MNKESFGDLNLLSISDLRSIDLFQLKLENGKFIPLYGPNGSGKSTVLDSLQMVFAGGSIPEGSIRDGKDEAKIIVESTGGYKITKRIRKIKNGKKEGEQTSELVMTKDNEIVSSAQTVLKDLFAGFITPNTLANATGADLYKKLVVAAGIDVSDIDEAISTVKSDLASVNAELRIMAADKEPEGIRPEIVEEYIPELHQSLIQSKDKLLQYVTYYADIERGLKFDFDSIEQLRKTLEARMATYQQNLKDYNEKLPEVKAREAEAKQIIEKIERMNIVAKNAESTRRWVEWDKRSAKKKEREEKKLVLDKKSKELDIERKTAIENTDLGVESLKLTADGKVVYDNHQWDIAAFSERMKVSALLSLKNMDKDKLPIMFIEHGESLSKDKREEIAKVAINQGAIVFIEVMTEDTTGCTDGVVMRISENVPVVKDKVKETPVPEKEEKKIGDYFSDTKTFKSLSDPVDIDLTGDLSSFSIDEINNKISSSEPMTLEVIEKDWGKATAKAVAKERKEDMPAKSPEELGMVKASDLIAKPPVTNEAFPSFDFFNDELPPVAIEEEESDPDPWDNLDIF